MADRLVRGYLALWDDPVRLVPMLAVIRSAQSYNEAALLLRELIKVRVAGRIVDAIGMPDRELRATLIGAQLVGLAIFRSVIKVEPLASADPEVIVGLLTPAIDGYLRAPQGPGEDSAS
jgi:hypothetical protein